MGTSAAIASLSQWNSRLDPVWVGAHVTVFWPRTWPPVTLTVITH